MAKRGMSWLDWTAISLLIVGGLNWGLVGIANFNLVEAIFGSNWFTRVVYTLVGVGAGYSIYSLLKLSKVFR